MTRQLLGRAALVVLSMLAGCAPTTYADITGQGRGQAQFDMDQGYCNMVKQSVPMEAIQNGCYGDCAAIVTTTNLMNLQNAFNNCMVSRGWQQS